MLSSQRSSQDPGPAEVPPQTGVTEGKARQERLQFRRGQAMGLVGAMALRAMVMGCCCSYLCPGVSLGYKPPQPPY